MAARGRLLARRGHASRYFDLPERMGGWRIHMLARLRRDEGRRRRVLRARHPRRAAGRAGRRSSCARTRPPRCWAASDDRNPAYYYGTSRVTPRKDFWGTREGKAVKRNWSAHQGELIDAFNAKADELVKVVHDVLEDRSDAQGDGREGRRVAQVGELRPFSSSSRRASSVFSSPPRPIPASTRRRLGELDLAVVDDLEHVAPRVAHVQAAARLGLDARLRQRRAHRLAVVDHEPEVARVVGWLAPPLREREELVADVQERHPGHAAAQLEGEDRARRTRAPRRGRRPPAPRG